MDPHTRARRYVAWLRAHARAIVLAHLAVFGVSLYLVIARLPLFADFTYLLPQDAPSVVDLHKLADRVKANDTVLVLVQAKAPDVRAAATAELGKAIRALPPALVIRVDGDDTEARTFFWDHRYLLMPLAELQKAESALRARIDAALLATNPLYIDLDDHAAGEDREAKLRVDELRARRHEAEIKLHRPSNVSADGQLELLEVRTAIDATDVDHGKVLLDALSAARARVMAAHPGVRVGLAGDLVTSIAEHGAIVNGTLESSLVTTLLVGIVLALYFRSLRLLGLLVGSLALATIVAFGTAAFTVGHLNAATAFLGAIIAGNGINYGILLIARFLEERRTRELDDALAHAIAGTLRPTAVASLGAAIAYGSLAATSFKGFADFAVIGGVGMVLCWLVTFGLLPTLVLLLFKGPVTGVPGDRMLAKALVRSVGFRRPIVVVAAGLGVTLAAGLMVARYLAGDPFEYDMRELGSINEASETERAWMHASDVAFGHRRSEPTFIAVDHHDQVSRVVAALRAQSAIGSVESIDDVLPPDQDAKLRVLASIRTMLDDDKLDQLDPAERAELVELRPPDGLAPITRAKLPRSILELATERSGRFGDLIAIRPADNLDELDGHDVIRFARAVSHVELGRGEVVTTSGGQVIFADILETIAHDGLPVTAIAALGLIAMVLLVVGRNARATVVLVATGIGTLLMIATCAAIGQKVSFLDFVALPITLGLGIDYAINVAHRHDHASVCDPIATLETSGAAVFVCSLTTMIGYGSLLVSDNLAIRGFGRASLIGEITTVGTALVLVPALLALLARRDSRDS